VQLPAVDPPVPAELGPGGLGVCGGVGQRFRLPILFVPHSAFGPKEGASGREALALGEQLVQGVHLEGGLFEHREQLANPLQAPY
jgi:hypothetical protein